MSSILAVTDPRNNKPIQGMEPFVISLILHGLGLGKFCIETPRNMIITTKQINKINKKDV